MTKYYKIAGHDEIHHGYHYVDGLNTLDKPFEDKGSCAAGGLYFTTGEYIHKFYHYGCNLCQIYLPIGHPDFKMIQDPAGG